MVYLKVNNRYKTLKEIALEHNVPLKYVRARYSKGIRGIAELTKAEDLRKKQAK